MSDRSNLVPYSQSAVIHGIRTRKRHLVNLSPEISHIKRSGSKDTDVAFFIRCTTTDCPNFINVSLRRYAHRRHCLRCGGRGQYVVCGRRTRSKEIYNARKIIVEARLMPYKPTTYWFMVACSTKQCAGRFKFDTDRTVSENRKRKCAYCNVHLGRRKRPYEWLYSIIVRNAAIRGIDCDLTYRQYVALCEKTTCHYCQSYISRTEHRCNSLERGGAKPMSYGVDRRDSTRGYTSSNVVPCCMICNITKSFALSETEMMIIGAARSGKHEYAGRILRKYKKDLSNPTRLDEIAQKWRRRSSQRSAAKKQKG